MCLVQTRTYVSAEGEEQTFERTRYCSKTQPGTLCNEVDHQTVRARLDVRKPVEASSTDTRTRDAGVIVTQDRHGRNRQYRQLSHSSGKQPALRSPTLPTSPSSPSRIAIKEIRPPTAPSPPPTGAQYPPSPYARCPKPDCPMSPIGNRSTSSTSTRQERRSSFSSTSAEPGDFIELGEAGPSTREKRVSITLPDRKKHSRTKQAKTKPEHRRHDSAKGFPTSRGVKDENPKRSDRKPAKITDQRSAAKEENDRQASLERARYQTRELQRAQTREDANDHIRRTNDAAAAAAARRSAEINAREAEEGERRRRIEAELRSAAQERQHQRGNSFDRIPHSPILTRSPVSPRLPLQVRTPINEQSISITRRTDDPIVNRGSEVIAREQARLEREQLQAMAPPAGIDDPFADEDEMAANVEVQIAEVASRREREQRYREAPRRRDGRRELWRGP